MASFSLGMFLIAIGVAARFFVMPRVRRIDARMADKREAAGKPRSAMPPSAVRESRPDRTQGALSGRAPATLTAR